MVQLTENNLVHALLNAPSTVSSIAKKHVNDIQFNKQANYTINKM
jgi:hypothetical protein